MKNQTYSIGNSKIEVLTNADLFLGLGKVWIEGTLVRSGRLPLRVATQTFTTSLELFEQKLLGVDESKDELRIKTEARFRPLPVRLLKDHSLDPIHDITDWDAPKIVTARLDIVIKPATDRFDRYHFAGFSYHYEYTGPDAPIFYLYDRASWELDGDITGATVFNQSACSDPVVTFAPETAWSTEGILFFLVEQGNANPIMTHNLPRWADHQAWDHQIKPDGRTLLGVFDRVDLVRSLLSREPGKPELKTFDKLIFDQADRVSTVPKKILLNSEAKSLTDQKNLWTHAYDELHQRARDEYGLKEQPPIPMMGQHYWQNYNIDTSYRDIVPACEAVGIRAIFTENFKRSDASEKNPLIAGNMCCSHEYEIAPELGGADKFKDYISRCQQKGIKNYMWTNTYVSLQAKMNVQPRDERGWYMAMEDTRIKYAGAYTMVSSNLDIKHPEARKYWVEAHRKIVKESGLDGYFIDSHYNLFFMPVNYKTGKPQTSWKESLQILKELQDDGVGWYIESFGPFGANCHGHHASYTPDKMFICYYVGLGDGSATVPVPGINTNKNYKHDAAFVYYQLAHKVPPPVPCFIDGVRIDKIYGDDHRRALREYHELLPDMHKRYLQEDGLAVAWHNVAGDRAIVWNFADRNVKLPGTVTDVSSGKKLPRADRYQLEASRTYTIEGGELPAKI